MEKKVSLLCTETGLKSSSLKAIAEGLSTKLGNKVWRTTKVQPKKNQFRYGELVDKLTQYLWFKEKKLSALEFTTDKEVAQSWKDSGQVLFARHLLNASCGHGIEVIDSGYGPLPFAPVYTLYKKKKREFRVHVFKDHVIAVMEKLRRSGWEGQQDTKIRNLANGYVFCQPKSALPEGLNELALAASKVTNSDFKGVDVGYNEKNNELFVIEVNSAPGIEGTNVEKYIESMMQYV
jgi:hypothetical protein